jgi:hypothetical protein
MVSYSIFSLSRTVIISDFRGDRKCRRLSGRNDAVNFEENIKQLSQKFGQN